MKNRKREICTSGTVRDEGGNILIYSAGSAIRADIVAKRFFVLERRTIFSHLDRNLEFWFTEPAVRILLLPNFPGRAVPRGLLQQYRP